MTASLWDRLSDNTIFFFEVSNQKGFAGPSFSGAKSAPRLGPPRPSGLRRGLAEVSTKADALCVFSSSRGSNLRFAPLLSVFEVESGRFQDVCPAPRRGEVRRAG
jgi:hypothetical protein